MNSSYARPCKFCGRRISMRQMPAGQWVAFEDDAAHKCAAPPKVKPARKVGLRHTPRSPVPPMDDEFGEFVLPNDKPVTGEKPTIGEFGTSKAPAPQPPVQHPAPGLAPPIRLPVGSAIVRPDPTASTPALPRAEPVNPVPSALGQGFRQWLLRVLAFMLILGLVKVVLREATRPNLPTTHYTPSTRSDALPSPAGQTSTPPSIKILQTRSIVPNPSASAPATPNAPGPTAGAYPPWLNKVTLPPSAKP
jgi:hypothetical protein